MQQHSQRIVLHEQVFRKKAVLQLLMNWLCTCGQKILKILVKEFSFQQCSRSQICNLNLQLLHRFSSKVFDRKSRAVFSQNVDYSGHTEGKDNISFWKMYIRIREHFSLRGNLFYILLLCKSTYTLIKCLVEIYSNVYSANLKYVCMRNQLFLLFSLLIFQFGIKAITYTYNTCC